MKTLLLRVSPVPVRERGGGRGGPGGRARDVRVRHHRAHPAPLLPPPPQVALPHAAHPHHLPAPAHQAAVLPLPGSGCRWVPVICVCLCVRMVFFCVYLSLGK